MASVGTQDPPTLSIATRTTRFDPEFARIVAMASPPREKNKYTRDEITVCRVEKRNGGWKSNDASPPFPGSLVEEKARESSEDETELEEGDEFDAERANAMENGSCADFDSIALDENQSLCSQQSLETSSNVGCTGSHSRLKSGDWVNEQLEMSRESLVFCCVSPKMKHVVHFNVKKGDVIVWEFATTKRNLGFGVLFESTVVEGDSEEEDGAIKGQNSSDKCEDNIFPILPEFIVNSHVSPIMGSHMAITDGVYVITFDNSYSKFFSKDLFYRITAQQAKNQLLPPPAKN